MIDRDTSRLWADHHIAFGRWVSDAARQVGGAFRTLQRIQYDSPWARVEGRRARH